MKRQAGRTLAVLALMLGLAAMGLAQPRTLTILHTNDSHSALLPMSHQPYPTPFTWLWPDHRMGWLDEFRGPRGFDRGYAGIARMSTLIKDLKRGRSNVLALHAGDVFVGSFEFNQYLGYPELKIMEGLYDAMSLGNHEFDLGMNTLAGIVSGVIAGGPPVTLPLLNANINLDGHALAGMIRKSIIKEIDGVKVGIFGLLNEDPFNYGAEVIQRFSGDISHIAGMQVSALEAAGCQVIICLSHLGTAGDFALADAVAGIDVIVGGHSHEEFRKAVVRGGKIIVQAGSHNRDLGELMVRLQLDGTVKLLKWKLHEVDKTVRPDPLLEPQLDALREGVVARFGPVYSETVATAFRPISHEFPSTGQYRDAPLGNLVTDAMRYAVKNVAGLPPVDCAFDALGYTEFGIPAGRVVGNDILRAVPYGYDPATGLGFKLVIVPMPGQLVLGGLDFAVANSLYAQVSGLTYSYHSGVGHIVPETVMINGEPVAANQGKIYFVLMTEGIFSFLNALAQGQLTAYPTGISEYTAVHDYMKSLGFVFYRSEGRVIDLAAPAATAVVRR
jgi:2',3'-cyclic-nucleotide 2'-phosphodiesterase (5'-nucleotidase family)